MPSKKVDTTNTATGSSPEKTRPKSEGRTTTLLKILGSIVTVVSGIVGLLFLFLPDLQPDEPDEPPSNQQAKLSELRLDPNITRAQYLDRMDYASKGFPKKELAVRGAFVEYRVEIVGYKGELLILKWELIDALSGDQLDEDRSDGWVPAVNRAAASDGIFVPLPRKTRMYYVRLELLRKGQYGFVPLTRATTERFPGLLSVQ
jgi:hypothetical protein